MLVIEYQIDIQKLLILINRKRNLGLSALHYLTVIRPEDNLIFKQSKTISIRLKLIKANWNLKFIFIEFSIINLFFVNNSQAMLEKENL